MKNPGRDWPLFILALDEENSASSSHEPRASGRSCTWGSRRDIHPGDRVRRSGRRCLMRIADVRTCGPPAVGRAVASPLVNGCGAPTHLHFTGHHHHLGANAPPWHLGNVDAPERRDTKHTTPRFARSARSPVGPDRHPRPSLPMPFHGDAAAPNGGGALDGRRTASLGVQHKGWAGHAGGSAVPRGTGGRRSKIRQVGTARRALLGLRNHRRVR